MIKKRWQKWIGRRFQLTEQRTLKQNDVFVFFNREGYLFLVLLIITFIAGVNYANNLILALCFLLTGILVLSFYLAFRQLYGLTIDLEVEQLGQVAQPLTLKFQFRPAKNQIHLHLRCQFQNTAKKITVLKSPMVVQFTDTPLKRGLHRLERFHFFSVYPFGIIKAWSYVFPQREIWIAPAPLEVDLQHYGLRQQNEREQVGNEDFSHLREFQAGDALNRIAWQQYAKGRGLLVKTFEQHQHQQLDFNYTQMTLSLHEEKLSQLMYLVQQAYDQHMAFSLQLPSAQLPLGIGEQHFHQAKLMLAQEP
ncbi:Protein of unknown function DUF58 [Acinetobacter marinus]|uniref:Uncharacterized protein n=1 Tax=Acinetobacter marinus TaxID=281375 RepID=A0A1G6GS78_9GAMM|nr:DUF58 domain-containing protein [Acinetobacter marinus]SDB84565.1 Protein of unknown function DUF58 [Acinetobacter marinus]